MGEHKCYIEPINDEDRKPSDAARSSKRRQRRVARALRFLQANDAYIHTLLARPHGAFQSQFYITKL